MRVEELSLYVGKSFGDRTILNEYRITKAGSLQWLTQCTCGRCSFIRADYVLSDKFPPRCLRCVKTKYRSYEGIGLAGVRMFEALKRTTTHEMNITIQDIADAWVTQEGKCYLTGLPLHFGDGVVHSNTSVASLDRIDSSKGYVVGNVAWVHKDVNIMKNKYDVEYFKAICLLVAREERRTMY